MPEKTLTEYQKMSNELERLSDVIKAKNVTIANLEKKINEITRVTNDWTNGYHDQEKMIAMLNEKHRNESIRQADALNIANAQRDAFKEAIQIILKRCKK